VKAQLQGALLMSLVPVDTVVTVASCTNDINNARCYYEHIILLIPDEFGHGTSCIREVISLAFHAYVECQK
jgi:hypothetical protein